jgi:hypothetical protein
VATPAAAEARQPQRRPSGGRERPNQIEEIRVRSIDLIDHCGRATIGKKFT